MNIFDTNLKRALRADVAGLVEKLVKRDRRRIQLGWPRVDCYTLAKKEISRCCGWDAKRGRFDQDQFDRAIARYLAGVRT